MSPAFTFVIVASLFFATVIVTVYVSVVTPSSAVTTIVVTPVDELLHIRVLLKNHRADKFLDFGGFHIIKELAEPQDVCLGEFILRAEFRCHHGISVHTEFVLAVIFLEIGKVVDVHEHIPSAYFQELLKFLC